MGKLAPTIAMTAALVAGAALLVAAALFFGP